MTNVADDQMGPLPTQDTENMTVGFDEIIFANSSNFTNASTSESFNMDNNLRFMGYVTLPLFSVVGLVGNALTVLIMSSTYFRSSTTSVYLSALAFSDTLYITVSPFTKSFVNKLINRDIRALSNSGCKLFFCLFRSAKICSSWFVVIICIERFLVIWFPLHVKAISVKRSAILSVIAVVVIVFTFDGVWTITSKIVNGVCLPNTVTPETKEISAAFVIAGTTIFNIIPTIVLVLFTPLTIFKLYKQNAIRRNLNATGGVNGAVHITKMLLSVSVAYIVLVTPISIAHSVAFFNGDNIFESTDPQFVYFREIAQVLESMNYCVNFFLYVVSNTTFRKKLMILLGCRSKMANPAGTSATGTGSRNGSNLGTISSMTMTSNQSVSSQQ